MDSILLYEIISSEYRLIKTADTIDEALIQLASLFNKLHSSPITNPIISQIETELAEEDRKTYENLEKAVNWFHDKIKVLSTHIDWEPNSIEMADINTLLNYSAISLQASGYIGSLIFKLSHLLNEIAHKEINHPAFEGWTCIDKDTGQRIFDYPEYVDKAVNSIHRHEQI